MLLGRCFLAYGSLEMRCIRQSFERIYGVVFINNAWLLGCLTTGGAGSAEESAAASRIPKVSRSIDGSVLSPQMKREGMEKCDDRTIKMMMKKKKKKETGRARAIHFTSALLIH